MSIKKDTIIRTAVLILALVNQVLVSTGNSVLPISDDQLTDAITLTCTVCASLWAWWRNNSFTAAAIAADQSRKGDDT